MKLYALERTDWHNNHDEYVSESDSHIIGIFTTKKAARKAKKLIGSDHQWGDGCNSGYEWGYDCRIIKYTANELMKF